MAVERPNLSGIADIILKDLIGDVNDDIENRMSEPVRGGIEPPDRSVTRKRENLLSADKFVSAMRNISAAQRVTFKLTSSREITLPANKCEALNTVKDPRRNSFFTTFVVETTVKQMRAMLDGTLESDLEAQPVLPTSIPDLRDSITRAVNRIGQVYPEVRKTVGLQGLREILMTELTGLNQEQIAQFTERARQAREKDARAEEMRRKDDRRQEKRLAKKKAEEREAVALEKARAEEQAAKELSAIDEDRFKDLFGDETEGEEST